MQLAIFPKTKEVSPSSLPSVALFMIDIWILCVAAHCYGDFLLQPDRIAKSKKNPWILLLHAAVHGMLAYLILQQWTWWVLPVAVFLLHGLIDFIKVRCKGGPMAFALDQAVHIISLGIIAALAAALEPASGLANPVRFIDGIVVGAGFVATVFGSGYFIASVARKMCAENPELEEKLSNGLKNGGATIGKLERALIFILIAIGQPAGIGFLVAAKSILRFEEAKEQPIAEYVLIGTLWSFGLAIALASLTFWFLS